MKNKFIKYIKDMKEKGNDFICVVYGDKHKGMSHSIIEDDENNSFFDTLEIMEKKRR